MRILLTPSSLLFTLFFFLYYLPDQLFFFAHLNFAPHALFHPLYKPFFLPSISPLQKNYKRLCVDALSLCLSLFRIMIMSFCKNGLPSFLGLTYFIDSNAAASVACPTAKASPPAAAAAATVANLARGVGLTTATGDMRRQPNVLESSAVKSSSPGPAAKKDPDRNSNMRMFLDDIGEVVDGLMSCTESLGFESSDERRVDDQMVMEDIESMSNKNWDDEWHHVGRTRWREESERRREKKFPPPLTSLNHKGQPSFFLRPVRRDGRLELTEVRIDRPEILRSSRQDGRLRLEFVRVEEEEEEEYQEEKEVEDVEEQLIEEDEEESDRCEVQDSSESIEYCTSEEPGDYDEERLEFEEGERMCEWRFHHQVSNEGFGRCYEVVNHREHHHHHHHLHHHNNLHVWSQPCVTTR